MIRKEREPWSSVYAKEMDLNDEAEEEEMMDKEVKQYAKT